LGYIALGWFLFLQEQKKDIIIFGLLLRQGEPGYSGGRGSALIDSAFRFFAGIRVKGPAFDEEAAAYTRTVHCRSHYWNHLRLVVPREFGKNRTPRRN
jgi:hypothetical protein